MSKTPDRPIRCMDCATQFQPSGNGRRCLKCRRKWDREWRQKRKTSGRPVKSTKMPLEYHRAYNIDYGARPGVKQRRAENMRIYRLRPDLAPKMRARTALRRAVESGIISRQPCEKCGKTGAQAHHSDYSKPLEVRWLCQFHHAQLHAKVEGSL